LKTEDSASASYATLQTAVDALSKWGAEWHITFEPTKSQAMTIGRKRPTWATPPIIFNDNAVKEEDEIKMLGLIADKHLTFAPQTKNLANRARQRLGFLRRASKYLHAKGRATVYKAFVRLRLESDSLAWMGAAQANLKRLDRV